MSVPSFRRAAAPLSLVPLVLGATLALASACVQLPREPAVEVDLLTPGDALRRLNPNDVVIPPVRNLARADLPDRALRQAFMWGLVRQRYVPLNIDLVDSRVVDASYSPGYLREEAVLELVVHRWDDALWRVQDQVTVEIEARMLDAANPDGPALWAAKLEETYTMTAVRERSIGEDEVLADLCRRIAETLCATMPARITAPE